MLVESQLSVLAGYREAQPWLLCNDGCPVLPETVKRVLILGQLWSVRLFLLGWQQSGEPQPYGKGRRKRAELKIVVPWILQGYGMCLDEIIENID